MPRRARTAEPLYLIPLAEAGCRLGVTDRTIRRWIAHGKLTGYRVNKHNRVDEREVAALIEQIPSAVDNGYGNGSVAS